MPHRQLEGDPVFSIRKLALVGLLTGASVASFASPAAAAQKPLTVDVAIGDNCLEGTGKPGTFLKVVVRDANGQLKGRDAASVSDRGQWEFCTDFFSDGIAAGDSVSVRVFDTSQRLSFRVPRVTLDVNRASDVTSGKAPAGMNLTVTASYDDFLTGNSYEESHHLQASSNGTWSHDFSSDGIDLVAGALIELSASASNGAVHFIRRLGVPGVFIDIGQSGFQGYGKPWKGFRVTLERNGSTIATGDAVGDPFFSGQFSGKFLDADDEPYAVVGGETLHAASLGAEGNWQIPEIDPSTNTTADEVSGTCFSNGAWVVLVQSENGFAFATGQAAGDGHFTGSVSDQTNLRKGDLVLVACLTDGGDIVEQEFTAR
jgi:hypothetical protein